MQITLIDPTTMRLAFRFSASTKDFIKALPGAVYDGKEAQTWSVPLHHLRTVATAFPQAHIAPDVLEARYELWRAFIRNYTALGVEFCYAHDGSVTCWPGAHISPALMVMIEARTAQLAPQLGSVAQRASVRPECPRMTQTGATLDSGNELILRSIQGAHKRSERVAEVRRAVGARRYRQKQLVSEEA